jgi:hypothetical protein
MGGLYYLLLLDAELPVMDAEQRQEALEQSVLAAQVLRGGSS